MADYLTQFHGVYFIHAVSGLRVRRTWWAERLDEETDLETTLYDIEEQEKSDRKMVRVIETESLRDVTADIREMLDKRHDTREAEAARKYANSGAAMRG